MWIIESFLNYWQVALFSFLIGVSVVFLAVKVFPKLGLMDRPQNYGLKRAPIPYYGGLAVYVAFMISVLVFVPFSWQLVGLLLGVSILVVLGFLDDYNGLSPWLRLAVQCFSAIVLIVSGIGVLSFNFPFFGTVDLSVIMVWGIPFLGAIFTVFWVMALVNTMNFVDGVSGLSSGVAFIAGLTLFLLSVHPSLHDNLDGQRVVALLSLILAMVSLAFFIFDFPKSKILMGDTGATFLGFMIAALAIFSGGKVATAFLVLGIPILDMVWVVLRRIYEGKQFWKGDLLHLHHRLLNIGFSDRMVVLLYVLVTLFLGGMAVSFVDSEQKFFMFFGLLFLMLVLAFMLVRYSKKNIK